MCTAKMFSMVLVGGFLAVYFWAFHADFLRQNVEGTAEFFMAEHLSCVAVYATAKNEIGDQISLLNLDSHEPQVMFAAVGVASPMKKVYDTEERLALQSIAAGSGSVEVFALDKKTGIFARAIVGTRLGAYASASKGTCQAR